MYVIISIKSFSGYFSKLKKTVNGLIIFTEMKYGVIFSTRENELIQGSRKCWSINTEWNNGRIKLNLILKGGDLPWWEYQNLLQWEWNVSSC